MAIRPVFCSLRSAVSVFELISFVFLGCSVHSLKQKIDPTVGLPGSEVSIEASSMKCTLQGSLRLPAFSMDGDFVVGGVFFLHYKAQTGTYNYSTKPEPLSCTGRLVT